MKVWLLLACQFGSTRKENRKHCLAECGYKRNKTMCLCFESVFRNEPWTLRQLPRMKKFAGTSKSKIVNILIRIMAVEFKKYIRSSKDGQLWVSYEVGGLYQNVIFSKIHTYILNWRKSDFKAVNWMYLYRNWCIVSFWTKFGHFRQFWILQVERILRAILWKFDLCALARGL